MARVTVVRAQPVQPPVEKVVLELSVVEARALEDLVCSGQWPGASAIEGSVMSAAGFLNGIGDKLSLHLRTAGVPRFNHR
jgi:hypothetical protein